MISEKNKRAACTRHGHAQSSIDPLASVLVYIALCTYARVYMGLKKEYKLVINILIGYYRDDW